jgi:hypothetical protein
MLPRGELFIGADFLEQYATDRSRSYVGQLHSAAEILSLSLIGVDCNSEQSLSLLSRGGYNELAEYFTVGYINGPVAGLIDTHGFYNAMVSIKKDSSLLMNVVENLFKKIKNVVSTAYDSGFNAICLADDIAGNKGLFFPMSYFTEVLLPIYKDIADVIKEKGMFTFFHSDGDMMKAIEPLIRARYDCIHPVDSQAGMSLDALREIFAGKVSFMGHIDIISWTEERITEEISLAENRFKSGGVILGSTCGISMKTISKKLGVLYPRLEWKEARS